MTIASAPVEQVDDLTATTLSNHNSPTPVDDRSRKDHLAAPMPLVGETILDRFRVVAWAGLGTASVVFRGEHVELHNPVAIKVVNRHVYPDRAVVIGHLRNEATILTHLRHPNLARVWDYSESSKYPCLVTDFIDGSTMRHMIHMERRIEQRRAVRAAIHIADLLITLNRAGIVHRDIKPENLVLSIDGSAKLIDFGLAIVQGRENPEAHAERLATPRVGTVAYLAPEQARNAAEVDQRADIYSLGATLYHAVTGRLPFGGNNAAQVILRHLEDEAPPPKAIVPNLHEGLSDLIQRMMAKKPRDRFASAQELLEALQALQKDLSQVS